MFFSFSYFIYAEKSLIGIKMLLFLRKPVNYFFIINVLDTNSSGLVIF